MRLCGQSVKLEKITLNEVTQTPKHKRYSLSYVAPSLECLDLCVYRVGPAVQERREGPLV